MRLLRILLQLLILALFLPILALMLVQRPLPLGPIAAALGLLTLSLLLTLLLGEYRAQRLDPRHDISGRVMAGIICLMGSSLLLFAWLIAAGQFSASSRRGQLLMLIIELIGPWLPAAIFAVLGLQMLWFSYRAWRHSR